MSNTKRRGHGEGSISLRQDGRWSAIISLENGKRKTFYGKTKKNILHKALDTALRWGLISRNVSELVTPPRKEHYKIQPLSIEQVQQLLKALPGNPLEMLFLLALGTGMRQGEILALKWQDIDLVRGTLQVRRVLTHVTVRLRKEGEPCFIETEPKTQRGRRCLVLPEMVIQALITHKEQQTELIRAAGRYWQHHDYVFCTKLGKHLTPNYVVTTFKRLLKKAGLPPGRPLSRTIPARFGSFKSRPSSNPRRFNKNIS